MMCSTTWATHIIGGDITYTCSGNGTFVITVTVTEECHDEDGYALESYIPVDLDKDGDGTFETTVNFNRISQTEIHKNIGVTGDYCINETMCLRENVYRRTVGSVTGDLEISVSLQNRHEYNNVTGGESNGFNMKTKLGVNALDSCDNSPVYTSSISLNPVVCLNKASCIDFSATDSDGDNLTYALVTPRESETTLLNYKSGFSATSPLTTSSGVSFNTSTGQMCFTPSAGGDFIVSVRIISRDENGVITCTTTRDVEIHVVESCSDVPEPFACMSDIPTPCEGDDIIVNANCSYGGHSYRWTIHEKENWDNGITANPVYSENFTGDGVNPQVPGTLNLTTWLSAQGISLDKEKCYVVVLEHYAFCSGDTLWSGTFREFCFPDMNPVVTVEGCEPAVVSVSVDGRGDLTYSWKGPSKTFNTPSFTIDPADKSIDEGWYVLTVGGQCEYTLKEYVFIPEDCCDAGITIESDGCQDYTFTINDGLVDIDCQIWKVDGQVVGFGEALNVILTEGSHEVCVNYMGISKLNGNSCCKEVCRTVNVGERKACFDGETDYCFGEDVMMNGICSDKHDRHVWQIYESPEGTGWDDKQFITEFWFLESGPNDPNEAGLINLSDLFLFENGKCYYIVLGIQKWCDGVLENGDISSLKICIHGPTCEPDQTVVLCEGSCLDLESMVAGIQPGEERWWGDLPGAINTERSEICPPELTLPAYTLFRKDAYDCVCATTITVTPLAITPIMCAPVVQDEQILNGPQPIDLNSFILDDCCQGMAGNAVWEHVDMGTGQRTTINNPGSLDVNTIPNMSSDDVFERTIIDPVTCVKCIIQVTFMGGGESPYMGVENSSLKDAFRLYPNPNQGSFELFFSEETFVKQVSVYSNDGKLIETKSLNEAITRYGLNINALSSGTYMIQVTTDTGVLQKTTVVIK